MRLSLLLSHSPPIGQALALNLSEGLDGALMVAHAIGGAMREAEVKFVDVTLSGQIEHGGDCSGLKPPPFIEQIYSAC